MTHPGGNHEAHRQYFRTVRGRDVRAQLSLALWLRKERNIRTASLLGAPFWLIYNLRNCAYGSAVGNVITFLSIAVAIVRYDLLKKEKPQDANEKT